jgi:hypothetical protein
MIEGDVAPLPPLRGSHRLSRPSHSFSVSLFFLKPDNTERVILFSAPIYRVSV